MLKIQSKTYTDLSEKKVKKYPFNEGDDYYTIINGTFEWSCWDDISEEMHDANPNKVYYREPNIESKVC